MAAGESNYNINIQFIQLFSLLFITITLFSVQHLSTFIMDKAESIVTVDDAIKKLVLLDSKDKIWTQELLLQVTDKAVRLMDCDTQVGLSISSRNHLLLLLANNKHHICHH